MNAALTIRTASDALALTSRERELAGIITAYNEVTERLKTAHERLASEVARLHEELRQKSEELRRKERLAALGEMAAGLAHEIRNPLGGIALYASMLERELAGQTSAVTAGKIFNGVRSLEILVREILDFAQEDRIDARPCDLGRVLNSVYDAAARLAEECGAVIHLEPPSAGTSVFCDPDRLHRALLNLVTNAVQAAGRDGWVRIAAPAQDDGISIEVTDAGPGIPNEDLNRIFNPFFTTKASGTGLGLAICHRIIEAHGGTIRAGNIAGGGARFVVWLPNNGKSIECEGRSN